MECYAIPCNGFGRYRKSKIAHSIPPGYFWTPGAIVPVGTFVATIRAPQLESIRVFRLEHLNPLGTQ